MPLGALIGFEPHDHRIAIESPLARCFAFACNGGETPLHPTATLGRCDCSCWGHDPTLAEPLAWPERITRIEDMPLQTRLHLSIPSIRVKGDVQRELIVKLLVDERGAVARGTVLQSCGNTDVDEAVLHALREARFQPFVEDGVAQAVSLVMPLHLPKWRAR